MILGIEMIVCCIIFTLLVIVGQKKNPLSSLHNMPVELQEKVSSLPQYKDVKVVHTKERILKKAPALLILMALFIWLIYVSGARNFMQGFRNSFLLWLVIKLYVVFVLDCGWLAHSPSVWILHADDMKKYYQDYVFYFKSIPRSLLAGLIVSVVVGIVIEGIV